MVALTVQLDLNWVGKRVGMMAVKRAVKRAA